MSLMDELADDAKENRRATCAVAKLLASMDADEADEVREAMASDYTSTAIYRVLRARGHSVGYTSIQRHRRTDDGCLCEL